MIKLLGLPLKDQQEFFLKPLKGKKYTFFFFFFCLFRATPAAYGDSQARGQIGAVAAGLHHSHSNAGSDPPLHPTPHTAHGKAGSLTH